MSGVARAHDFASAALRHIRDAVALLWSESYASTDQAWHLAGFGPECARKAALSDDRVHRILGHDAHDPSLLSWLQSLDQDLVGPSRSVAPTSDWKPSHRYEATGTRARQAVAQFVAGAEIDTLEIIGALWCAGRLPRELP